MYLISELCMNPAVKEDVCKQCGQCGREFKDGHITKGRSCETCRYYDRPMSECRLSEAEDHNERFVFRGFVCHSWQDVQDGVMSV